ncbi:hydrolase TatD [Enterobacteriaceae endosymbiont of Donacia tomentosa]|uniref:TatD family hydrolase n=1 Tax=Enterobacteriaceae endosymbiont of Donacia tomentosa TaxID=2675787 RepID=UPI001449323C|nr:TatD family hydrolase [Enterobacteriaceae endosymbiont of Donacia tomentosa]QJC31720.1 hydrolase TatD [Enterobacteriaceae endosymbiont of Donacia tomentosa]
MELFIMFDISVNLTNKQFFNDKKNVISRAINNGIKGMLIVGCNIKDSYNAYKITQEYKNYCWSTVGIHPHYAGLWDYKTIEHINKLIQYNNVVAIGECGLDFYRNFSSIKQQLFAFHYQLELSSYYSIPIYLHCRNAFQIFIKILKSWIHKIPKAVIHCFSGNQYELKQCLDMNLYIGISELFFNKKYRNDFINNIRLIPQNKLLVETDSPFLLFKTTNSLIYKQFNGRNEPSLLPNLLKKISVLRKENFFQLKEKTEYNARIFLNLKKNNCN